MALPTAGKRRSHYIGYIINLAAKAFLFGQDIEGFETVAAGDLTSGLETSTAQKAAQEWRKKGPIGKLHNLVMFIRSSTLRREA